jgi:allophanate hydrolase subunit 2
MTQEEIKLEAEKYARRFEENEQGGYNGESLSIEDRIEIEAFITGATSKHVEKQKLEFAIEQLNKLDSVLQANYEILSNMQQEYLGKMKEGQLASKKSGLRLAKEETRRNIKELEQQLNDL